MRWLVSLRILLAHLQQRQMAPQSAARAEFFKPFSDPAPMVGLGHLTSGTLHYRAQSLRIFCRLTLFLVAQCVGVECSLAYSVLAC